MSHMVIYRGSDGKPGYHQADDLSSAIKYVEHLRNDDGVERARIFRMEEVSFEFRPYYRVELGLGGMAGSSADAPPPPVWSATPTSSSEDDGTDADETETADAPADDPIWADAPAASEGLHLAAEDRADHDVATAGAGNRRGLFGR